MNTRVKFGSALSLSVGQFSVGVNNEPIPVVGKWLRRVVQGYFNYHAVPGNSRRLSAFRWDVARAWLHALRRRGQHGRMPWDRFRRHVASYLPLVRVLHPYPSERFTS